MFKVGDTVKLTCSCHDGYIGTVVGFTGRHLIRIKIRGGGTWRVCWPDTIELVKTLECPMLP